jgi:hypothetical protein
MKSLDVKSRHTFITQCLKKMGIEVIANGSDGDSRKMKFMLEHTGLERPISSFLNKLRRT